MTELEKRITVALTDAITSAELDALIEETETAIVTADAAADAERERALDPLASPDVGKARAAMEDAAFTRDRLRTVLPRLQIRLTEVEAAEYAARWQADYERVETKCEALAKEFEQFYPDAVAKLADLLSRMAEADREAGQVNSAAPDGDHRRILSVELVARQLQQFSIYNPPISKALQLPSWENSTRMAWPPLRSIDPALFAPVPFDRRYSPDWWRVKEEEVRVAQERAIREAEELQAKADAEWHGPLWWLGERA